MKLITAFFTLICTIIILLASSSANARKAQPACLPPHDQYPFCNTSLSIDERLLDLIVRIKNEDKPNLMTARGWPQGNVTGIPYLGVPPIDSGLNCLRSVQSSCIGDVCPTLFSNPTSLGASFNMSNVYAMGKIIGVEARALFLAGATEPNTWSGEALIAPSCWSPNSNLAIHPVWGRNQEVPTEDVLIGSAYIEAYTKGMQFNPDIDPKYIQCVTTQKHFAAYDVDNVSATGVTRYSFNAKVSPHDLAETFLPVFQAGVVNGGAKSVMLSYNAATFPYPGEENGIPTAASKFLRDTLRDVWNFSGYTTSDTDSVGTIYRQPPQGHAYVKTGEEAVALALKDGRCDMNSGGTFDQFIPSALEKGLISQWDLDTALADIYRVRFEMGFFDPIDNQPFWKIPLSAVNTQLSKSQAYLSAVQGMVLLQNRRNALPISQNFISQRKKIAVIGPSVNDSRVLLGNYLGWVCPGGDNDFSCVETVCGAIQKKLSSGSSSSSVQCASGSFHDRPSSSQDFNNAIQLAKESDVIILAVGLDQNLEAEMHDRTSLELPYTQKYLIQSVRRANPNAIIVMVMINGGVLAIERELPLVDAVLEAWYPGFYGAQAIADTIFFGDAVPAGRLPVTMYYSNYTQFMNETDMSMVGGLGRTYRYFKDVPLFPFGFGLSYYTFDYAAGFEILPPFYGPNGAPPAPDKNIPFARLEVSMRSKDSGDRLVDDVLQMFVIPESHHFENKRRGGLKEDHSVMSLKKLVGFTRLSANQQLTTHYRTEFPVEALCFASDSGRKELVPGKYSIVLTNDGLVTKLAISQFEVTYDMAFGYQCDQVFSAI